MSKFVEGTHVKIIEAKLKQINISEYSQTSINRGVGSVNHHSKMYTEYKNNIERIYVISKLRDI